MPEPEVGLSTQQERLDTAIQDLNEERPRPVLGGRTAREVLTRDRIDLPDRQRLRREVEQMERQWLARACSRAEKRSARRRATEEVLLACGFMKRIGDVSREFWKTKGTLLHG